MAEHVRNWHRGNPQHECTRQLANGRVCGALFNKQVQLDAHIAAIHEGEQAEPTGPLCGKRFCTGAQRKRHVRLYHQGEQVLRCRMRRCDDEFQTRDECDAHMLVYQRR